ncbi:MAG: hypothetical protein H3Z53_09270 [archaeon]|nr:hypothetical protein [archaeon]MCP8314544.1 hypothetical protein [archaeon]
MNRREIASAFALALMILMVFSWNVPVVLTQLETYDYGDAPDPPYPSLLASDGARHYPGTIWLGSNVDFEFNSIQAGDNYDDGVDFWGPGPWWWIYVPGQEGAVFIHVRGSGVGYLHGWFDWNQDGDWDDTGENVFSSINVSAPEDINLDFIVPADALPGETWARFRVDDQNLNEVTGFAGNGEVEDYKVEIAEVDYGDAPDPYPTLLASNGACHSIDGWTYLGAGVDGEPDGQPDANALGDDNNGVDDEDGVVFTSLLIPGMMASVDVTSSVPAEESAYLNAWVDFNADGDWADLGEYIFENMLLYGGLDSLTFLVPSEATPGMTYARFRFSRMELLSFDGWASDGEVEDYQVEIEAAPVPVPVPVPVGGELLLPSMLELPVILLLAFALAIAGIIGILIKKRIL